MRRLANLLLVGAALVFSPAQLELRDRTIACNTGCQNSFGSDHGFAIQLKNKKWKCRCTFDAEFSDVTAKPFTLQWTPNYANNIPED